MLLITPPPPIPPIIDTKVFRPRGGLSFRPAGGRIFRKNFMIDSGKARRADQFDIDQHEVSEAYK